VTPAIYLVDASTLIDASHRHGETRERLMALLDGGNVVGICPVVTGEFLAGIALADRGRWRQWLEAFTYWDISRSAAIQAGEWRYDFARQGVTLSLVDALIAAVAMDIDAVLVTSNVKHFPMTGIELMSLR
jgi:predicted nucleic acid-binding protein